MVVREVGNLLALWKNSEKTSIIFQPIRLGLDGMDVLCNIH
jgi:hypothetical protein